MMLKYTLKYNLMSFQHNIILLLLIVITHGRFVGQSFRLFDYQISSLVDRIL